MNSQTQKYFQVLQFIAHQKGLNYVDAEKELMASVKPIQTLAIKKENSPPSTHYFYRRFNILFLALIPVSVFISVGLRQFFHLYNYLGVFVLSMIAGIILISLVHAYEKKFNLILAVTPDGLTTSGKNFQWENIAHMYLFTDSSYFRKHLKYYLIICTNDDKMYMSDLTHIKGISKVADSIVNNWNN